VEFDRIAYRPESGDSPAELWLGPAGSGQAVRFWANADLIKPFIGGTRVKTERSHATVTRPDPFGCRPLATLARPAATDRAR
jgi:hypothetical protein